MPLQPMEDWVGFLITDYGLSWLDACFGISTAWLVVWKPLCLDPSDGVFSGRFVKCLNVLSCYVSVSTVW